MLVPERIVVRGIRSKTSLNEGFSLEVTLGADQTAPQEMGYSKTSPVKFSQGG